MLDTAYLHICSIIAALRAVRGCIPDIFEFYKRV